MCIHTHSMRLQVSQCVHEDCVWLFAVCLQLEDAERLEQVIHAIWFSCYSVNMFGIDYCFQNLDHVAASRTNVKARMTLLKATTPSVGADIEWFDYQSRGKLGKLCCRVARGWLKVLCAPVLVCVCVCLCVEGWYRPVVDVARASLPWLHLCQRMHLI